MTAEAAVEAAKIIIATSSEAPHANPLDVSKRGKLETNPARWALSFWCGQGLCWPSVLMLNPSHLPARAASV